MTPGSAREFTRGMGRGEYHCGRDERLLPVRLGARRSCDHLGVTEATPAVRWDRYDTAIVTGAAIATIFVHPVRTMLKHPFWLDEAWVAALTRAPLARLPHLSSSAPFGFVALLQLVPGSGLQRGRLLVLGFSLLTVAASYVLARTLGWRRRSDARFAATVTALVVMLAPVSLIRNDLKQYTCDAFCAVALLAFGARAERAPSRKSLLWLAGAGVVTAPLSSTALFVTVAVFAGLLASAALDRARSRVIEIVVVGGATGVALAAYFAAAVAPNLNPKLRAYWASQYLTGSPLHIVHATWNKLARLGPDLAMPVAVFVVLFALGLVVLVRVRARALAIAMPFLWLEMAVIGRLRRYPYLDLRTSQFLLVTSLFVVALGALGIVAAVRAVPRVRGIEVGTGGAGVTSALLAVLFAIGFVHHVRELNIPAEDVRSETFAVSTKYQPHDVVLVNESANFGFSYYWPHGHMTFHHDDSGQGFGTELSGVDAVYISSRTYQDIAHGLREAVDRWRRAGPDSHLYIVRTHLSSPEEASWQRAFTSVGLTPRPQAVGVDPLLVLGPA